MPECDEDFSSSVLFSLGLFQERKSGNDSLQQPRSDQNNRTSLFEKDFQFKGEQLKKKMMN
ncbi:hypothetical protein CDL15_Pgr013956 [Punica granatum]|uniref:Uncharacterized protein n=1 Tax=Punica granatum TaxID=22663 RepID=A0A218W9P9_PUNGR|nr:hypothetical protein CDL15_Pgr013956 [Punica granatum]